MYFAIGGHPAFNVPVLPDTKRSDYRLTFDGQDSLTYLLLDPETGTAKADEEATLKLENGTCQIDDHMFDHDALVFDNQITKAGIATSGRHSLSGNALRGLPELRHLVRFPGRTLCMPGAMDGPL